MDIMSADNFFTQSMCTQGSGRNSHKPKIAPARRKNRSMTETIASSPVVGLLARIMHKLSTAVPQSSTLTALRFLGLLGVLHEYACGALRCTPCHRGACNTSSRRLHLSAVKKTMHNPGLTGNVEEHLVN